MNLKDKYLNSGKTQEMIAAETDLNYTTVYNAIEKPWRVSWPTFRKIGRVFNLTDNELYNIWRDSKIERLDQKNLYK